MQWLVINVQRPANRYSYLQGDVAVVTKRSRWAHSSAVVCVDVHVDVLELSLMRRG